MIRKLTDLSQQIQRQEAVLDVQRHIIFERYRGLKIRYRRRLSSPMTLMTSLAAGLVIGTLSRRFRRRAKADSKPVKYARFSLIKAVARPVFLHIARTKGVQLIENAMRR